MKHVFDHISQSTHSPPPPNSLRVEVDQHGKLAVDDPLREVLLVLNVEGDVSA